MAEQEFQKTLKKIEQRNSTPSPSMSTCRNCAAELQDFREHSRGLCAACLNEQYRKQRLESVPAILTEDYRIPSHFRNMDWTTSEVVAPYLNSARGLYLTGLAGRGKTANLCLLARDWLLKWAKEGEITSREIVYLQARERASENTWRFISFPSFIMEIQDAWRREENEETAYTRLKRVARAPRLIIDELGAEKLTDYVRQATYFLINEREQEDRTTYITSNYSLKDLDRQMNARISSRIAGMCDIKHLEGEDLRLRRLPGREP